MYYRMKFAIFFRFVDSWCVIKYLLTETPGKQYVLWTLGFTSVNIDSLRSTKHTVSLLFPWSQSISVKYQNGWKLEKREIVC